MKNNETEICRLCGELTKSENLKLNVNEDIGGVKLQQCIAYYCRIILGKKQKSNKIAGKIPSISKVKAFTDKIFTFYR